MGMDHRYGSYPLKGYRSWVWIMGYGSYVVPGYGSEPYILSHNYIFYIIRGRIKLPRTLELNSKNVLSAAKPYHIYF